MGSLIGIDLKKIRVLHISPDGVLFGTERHILSIVKNSNRDEFEHSVSVPRQGSFTEELDKIGIPYHMGSRMPAKSSIWGGFFENKGIIKFLKLVQKGNYDIIHTHLNSYGGILAKAAGNRKIVHTRHGIFWTEDELRSISGAKKGFQKIKSRLFSKTIALSEIEKKIMVESFGYDPSGIEIIYNGVTIDDIRAKINPAISKKELFGTDDFIVGSIGRFERQKGYHFFIQAAQIAAGKIPGIRFVLIGRGSLRNSLQDQVRDAGLEGVFSIMDYQQNVFDYLDKFDIMVSSSLWEGVPYAILEALALGKPTIAFTSKLSGVTEIFDSGVNGFLVEEDYVNRLAELIVLLHNDKALYAEISNNALEQIKKKFSESVMINKTENLYKGLLARGTSVK